MWPISVPGLDRCIAVYLRTSHSVIVLSEIFAGASASPEPKSCDHNRTGGGAYEAQVKKFGSEHIDQDTIQQHAQMDNENFNLGAGGLGRRGLDAKIYRYALMFGDVDQGPTPASLTHLLVEAGAWRLDEMQHQKRRSHDG